MTKTMDCPQCGTDTLQKVFIRENFDVMMPDGKEKLLIRFPCYKCNICAEKFPAPDSQQVIQQAIKEFFSKKLETAGSDLAKSFQNMVEKRQEHIDAQKQYVIAVRKSCFSLGVAVGACGIWAITDFAQGHYWLGSLHLAMSVASFGFYIKSK